MENGIGRGSVSPLDSHLFLGCWRKCCLPQAALRRKQEKQGQQGRVVTAAECGIGIFK